MSDRIKSNQRQQKSYAKKTEAIKRLGESGDESAKKLVKLSGRPRYDYEDSLLEAIKQVKKSFVII